VNSGGREVGHVLKTVRNFVASVYQTGHPKTYRTHYQLTFAMSCFHILCETNCSRFLAYNNLVTSYNKIITELGKRKL
jgi:hypothetical protein